MECIGNADADTPLRLAAHAHKHSFRAHFGGAIVFILLVV